MGKTLYIVPEHLRDTLNTPLGTIAHNDLEVLHYVKNASFLVSVGDRVTTTLLQHTIVPDLCIVDYILERKPYATEMKQLIQQSFSKKIQVKNPAGVITDELWNAVQSVFSEVQKMPVCIEVDGEEDLASLVVISIAPIDVTIIYGLPNRGVNIVTVTQDTKHLVSQVLEKM